jgi:hypothetical protein
MDMGIPCTNLFMAMGGWFRYLVFGGRRGASVSKHVVREHRCVRHGKETGQEKTGDQDCTISFAMETGDGKE